MKTGTLVKWAVCGRTDSQTITGRIFAERLEEESKR